MGEVGGAVGRGAPAIGARAPPRMDALFGMALALVAHNAKNTLAPIGINPGECPIGALALRRHAKTL